jgi:hypothetical protein
MPDKSYASFMLRLQWMPNPVSPTWVASIQSTRTGELRHFSSVDALVQFLKEEFREEMACEEGQPGTDMVR